MHHQKCRRIVSAIDVYKVLNGLDISKATGHDNISNKLLKEASVHIAELLSHLFNFSLSLGTFPDASKLANVIPIFKKGDTMLCTNYRSISLLYCISKVFEKIIFDHIYTASPTLSPFHRLALLVHVSQKGDTMLCTNYHPITRLCCISKVFEKIIFDHIYAYLKYHGIPS